MKDKDTIIAFLISILVLILSIGIAVMWGSTGWVSLFDAEGIKVVGLRFPRVLVALISGGTLAICGVALQAILENPLAEPFLLGVSGGAVLGGTIGILFGALFSNLITGIRIFAFGGAILSLFFLIFINKRQGRINPINMLLTGVIFNGFVSALVTLFKALIPATELQRVTLWLSGYIPYFTIGDIVFEVVVVLLFSILLLLESNRLNLLSVGSDIAITSGVNVERLRMRVFVYTSVLTGVVVSITGLIGFVGLIVPQGIRAFKIINNRVLLPLSFISGGTFVIIGDLICRLISYKAGFEPPISSITAIVGAPVLFFLLRRYYKMRGGY